MGRTCRQSGWVLALGLGATTASATTYTVSSISALQSQIKAAVAGDTIVVSNGTYTTGAAITVSCVGTATSPVLIAAASTGGVEIAGVAGFDLVSPAAYVTIQGFNFTHSAGGAVVEAGTSHCKITRNVFQCPDTIPGPSLLIKGDDCEVSYNTLQNKVSVGQMIYVLGPNTNDMAQRTWIHHNYFYNFAPLANSCSGVYIGVSERSFSSANSIVEYNLFVGMAGEIEGVVCNKSWDNVYRYNTIGAACEQLSLRQGARMQVYGNFFLGGAGIRFCQDDHQIYNNYFQGCRDGIICNNGDGIVPVNSDPLAIHDRPDRVQIVNNTLVNCAGTYQENTAGTYGATYITFANNILSGCAPVSIPGPYTNPTWAGNIIWNGAAGDVPAGGYTVVDPKLVADANGIFRLQAGSPAIGASVGAYSFISEDMDGQPRPAVPAVGADEYSTATVLHRPLTVADVGPGALPQVATPVLNPSGGAYASAQAVTITSATSGAVVRYTTDGSMPTETYGTVYNGAIGISVSTTLAAIAYKPGYADSNVAVATFAVAHSQLSNVSVRTNLAAGQPLMVGFVTTGPKKLLARAIGPSLTTLFGLSPSYPDPTVTITNPAGSVIGQNAGWTSDLNGTFAATGAFPLSAGSKDAALVQSVSGGNVATVTGPGSGIVLVEVYDADPSSTGQLINVSARNLVGTGGNVLIAGFVISGTGTKNLLIRGSGPALAALGVPNTLPDPTITVYRQDGSLVATNDNWDASLTSAFVKVGAFPFSPASKDAALLATLPAGSYTVQLSGVGNTTGDGLIEVYDLGP